MARIRTIKPDFWRDESLASVSPEAALLAIGLLNHADDEGYFNAHPKLIESDIFPLRELSNTITVMIDELHRIGYIELYKGHDGKRYGHICNFSKHQVINKKNPSKIKALCEVLDDSVTTTVVLPVGMEGKGKEKEKEKKATKVAATVVACPPDVEKQVWDDWLSLRKSKGAKVTQTVLDGAISESVKAGMSLENFLRIWCLRGSQGLQAEWLKPNERQPFANKYDVAHITTPPPPNQDAALRKIEEDSKRAVKPNAEVQARIANLMKGKVA